VGTTEPPTLVFAATTPPPVAVEEPQRTTGAASTPPNDEAATTAANRAPSTQGEPSEVVGMIPTRSGRSTLSVTPRRLPFRMAELLGEQRQLEEALTLAHRRIDEVEEGDDSGSGEKRIRLSILRDDLDQKQERLREILFLQDGYRWMQQQMAPDLSLAAGTP